MFLFGKNWQNFSKFALNEDKVDQGRKAFQELFGDISFKGKKFLDIGFGQGLAIHFAGESGAECMGIDIDSENLKAIKETNRFFKLELPQVKIQSILEEPFVEEHRQQFDIVHSWGVLHHTGDMERALEHAAQLVKPGGIFVMAIYNRHWSSLAWWWIKKIYNMSPEWMKGLMISVFYPIIYFAKWLVTKKNPKDKLRGMDFYYDVIDWVGGFPYEYASLEEITNKIEQKGFICKKTIPANVPTGCNEFLFVKKN